MKDLWQEALDTATKHQEPTKTLIIVGDKANGKSKLKGRLDDRALDDSELSTGTLLEYDFIDVHDPDNPTAEPLSRLDIWTINGHESNSDLLKFVLSPDTIACKAEGGEGIKASCMLMVTIDLSKPWTLPSAVTSWVSLIEKCLQQIFSDCPEILADLKTTQENYFKEFRQTDGFKEPLEENYKDFPLDGALTKNLGIPIVIVGTKADQLPSKNDDLLQQQLREIAFAYGAALLYTNSEDKSETVDVLRQYIFHRLFGFDYGLQENVVVYDEIFIPAGWDAATKIKSVITGAASFASVFTEPIETARVERRTPDQVPPTHQAFLKELKEIRDTKHVRQDITQQIHRLGMNTGQQAGVSAVATEFFSQLVSDQKQKTTSAVAAALGPGAGKSLKFTPARK